MDSSADRDDVRSAVAFLATPMIVDLLRAVRHRAGSDGYLDVVADDDVIRHAIEVLAVSGTATVATAATDAAGGRRLALTPKGYRVCALVDELVDLRDDAGSSLAQAHTGRLDWPTRE